MKGDAQVFRGLYLLLGDLYIHFPGPQIDFVSKRLNIMVPFYR